eukprot:TRINITY_DN1320_c0_g2_i1.p1 TRINITY_DN1320_c0_g2~~TRINITY_DN1320_c0_g2_i1.p1  ORF type:complete len:276 (+),score=27.15 TRINITY_DN1320_c0_g2_i1:52-828(+)
MATALTHDQCDFERYKGPQLQALIEDNQVIGQLPVHDTRFLSCAEFVQKYEKTNKPVLIQNCHLDWPAANWRFDSFEAEYGPYLFALYNGQQFSLSEYLQYAQGRAIHDLQPLYLFDDLSKLSPTDDCPKSQILNSYTVPKYFCDDLFTLDPVHLEFEPPVERPRYRWIIIGPPRSGTCLHIDPVGTSAWNTVLLGHKRWVLFPPNTNTSVIQRDGLTAEQWFIQVLPLLDKVETGLIEFTQGPGDTLFVPQGLVITF